MAFMTIMRLFEVLKKIIIVISTESSIIVIKENNLEPFNRNYLLCLH